ncbi:MAG: hypothetical protein AAFU03_04560 [Bacteroidota bacterium]
MQIFLKYLKSLFFITLLTYITITHLKGQLGIDLNYVKPTGSFGQNFAAGPGITLRYSPNGNDRGRYVGAYTLGLFRVSPHQDTLFTNYSFTQLPRTFFGGYTIYEPYTYITIGSEGNFYPFLYRAFAPFGIIALNANLVTRNFITVDARSNSTVSEGNIGIGGGIGAGVEYATEGRFTFRFSITRFWNFSVEQEGYTFWRTSLGATYFW